MKISDNIIILLKSNFLLISGVLCLFPFIALSFYAHPAIDDYWYAYKPMELGSFGAVKYWYINWTGRYFTTTLLSLNPLVINWFFGYKLIPVILLILFFFSSYSFIRASVGDVISKKDHIGIALLFCSLYLYHIPKISLVIYWLAGSLTYLLANILLLFFLAFLIKFNNQQNINKRGNLKYIFFIILFIIAIIGTNEIAMFILDLGLAVYFLIYLFENKKINKYILVFILVALIASCLMTIAPGNKIRLEYEASLRYSESMGNIYISIISSVKESIIIIIDLISTAPMIISTIIFIPLAIKISNNKKNLNLYSVNPVITVTVFFILWILCFFPPFYCRGLPPPKSTLSHIYIYFFIGWFYNIQVLVYYLNTKRALNVSRLPDYVYILAVIFAILILLRPNNIRTAYGDLFLGRAAEYNREHYARYEAIKNCKNHEICEIDRIKSWPKTIYVTDITEDETYWKNVPYALYFDKKGVRLKQAE